VLGIRYSEGHGPYMRGAINVRDFREVAREMKANYRRKVKPEPTWERA
jgi:hypothetical protein